MNLHIAIEDRFPQRIFSPGLLHRVLLAICIGVIAAVPCNLPAAARGEVTHVVIFWLKRPGNAHDRLALAHASKSFRSMPGVLRVDVGRAMPIERPGIEQSFDLSVVFTFRDHAALQRFEKDPRHLAAVESTLKPLVRRFVVFNSVAE